MTCTSGKVYCWRSSFSLLIIAVVCSFSASAFVVPINTPITKTSTNVVGRNGRRSVFGVETTTTTKLSMAQRRRFKGPARVIEQKPPMNDEIEATSMRVTTPNAKGKDDALGIMSKSEALEKAREMGGLDLILINAQSDPPVCKIADYSKYRYEKEKKAKELKKNSKATEVKEVKMSYKIDSHDYGVRANAATKFLKQGNRVKVSIMFRGREIQHDQLGYELIDKLALDLEKIAIKEGKAKRAGRSLTCILSPRPDLVKSINDAKRAEEKQKRRAKEASLKEREEKLKQKEEARLAELGGVEAGAAGAAVEVGAAAGAAGATSAAASSSSSVTVSDVVKNMGEQQQQQQQQQPASKVQTTPSLSSEQLISDLSSALDDIDTVDPSKPEPTLDDLASALDLSDDLGSLGGDDDDDDDSGDDDTSLASSLDDLLSGGDLTDDLFT